MNRTDFLKIMQGSAPVDRQQVGEVYELIDIFPYFHSAHMLLLRSLQSNGDVKFESQLRNSSLFIADREVLYNNLSAKNTLPVIEKEDEKELSGTVNDLTESHQTVIESAKNSEQLINEIENIAETVTDNTHSPGQSAGHSILVSENYDDEPAGAIIVMDEEEGSQVESVFYMDPGIAVPESSDLLELDLTVENSSVSDEVDEKKETPVTAVAAPVRQIQADLIDKFIIANPRIEPIRDKSAIPTEDISKPFVESEGSFVTETLARIYINQGYYSKAIDIYEKLSLKFPEKSSYFASQIEKVKEYIKK